MCFSDFHDTLFAPIEVGCKGSPTFFAGFHCNMKYAELVNLSISPVTYFTRVEWGCPRLSRLGGLGERRKPF